MIPTRPFSPFTRRDFLKYTSAFTVSGGVLLHDLRAQDAKFVTAETIYGRIRGVDNNGIKTFKGIPYGASTSGANRFMTPAEPAKWTGVRDALEYGHSAPQRDPSTSPRPAGALTISGENLPAEGEDCLVLNVWTPATGSAGNSDRQRPVMFWCHGGGFATGSGSSPDNDGTNLARRGDVVVVTINHRLNVLGFANLSEFSTDFAASGDAGMMDIVQALKWVRANISQFGGDPNTVTIFGQSGGGRKVETLLAMPSAKGLLARIGPHARGLPTLPTYDHVLAQNPRPRIASRLPPRWKPPPTWIRICWPYWRDPQASCANRGRRVRYLRGTGALGLRSGAPRCSDTRGIRRLDRQECPAVALISDPRS